MMTKLTRQVEHYQSSSIICPHTATASVSPQDAVKWSSFLLSTNSLCFRSLSSGGSRIVLRGWVRFLAQIIWWPFPSHQTLDAHVSFKLNSSKPVCTTPTSVFMPPYTVHLTKFSPLPTRIASKNFSLRGVHPNPTNPWIRPCPVSLGADYVKVIEDRPI